MSIYNRYDILTEFAKKKKSNVRTCLNGAKDATGASQTFDAAKLQKIIDIRKRFTTYSIIFMRNHTTYSVFHGENIPLIPQLRSIDY